MWHLSDACPVMVTHHLLSFTSIMYVKGTIVKISLSNCDFSHSGTVRLQVLLLSVNSFI